MFKKLLFASIIASASGLSLAGAPYIAFKGVIYDFDDGMSSTVADGKHQLWNEKDDLDKGLGLSLGYQFNPYFAMEISALDFGKRSRTYRARSSEFPEYELDLSLWKSRKQAYQAWSEYDAYVEAEAEYQAEVAEYNADKAQYEEDYEAWESDYAQEHSEWEEEHEDWRLEKEQEEEQYKADYAEYEIKQAQFEQELADYEAANDPEASPPKAPREPTPPTYSDEPVEPEPNKDTQQGPPSEPGDAPQEVTEPDAARVSADQVGPEPIRPTKEQLREDTFKGYDLAFIFVAPVTQRVSIYGKGSIFAWDHEYSYVSSSSAQDPVSGVVDVVTVRGSKSNSGVDFGYGFGFNYLLGERVDAFLDYQRYELEVDDISVDFDHYSLGLRIYF